MLVLKKNENNNAINYLHLLIHISIQNKRGKTSVLRLSDLLTGVWIFWTHTIHIIGGIFQSINSVSSKNLFFKELYHFISILHYKNIIPLKFINRCTSLKPVFLYKYLPYDWPFMFCIAWSYFGWLYKGVSNCRTTDMKWAWTNYETLFFVAVWLKFG